MEYWYSKKDWEKMTNEEQKELEDYLEQEEGCVRYFFSDSDKQSGPGIMLTSKGYNEGVLRKVKDNGVWRDKTADEMTNAERISAVIDAIYSTIYLDDGYSNNLFDLKCWLKQPLLDLIMTFSKDHKISFKKVIKKIVKLDENNNDLEKLKDIPKPFSWK